MKDLQNIPEQEIDDIIKKTFLLEPENNLEDNIMHKIYATEKKYTVQSTLNNWLPKIIFGLLASIFIYFLLAPINTQFFSKFNSTVDLNKYKLVDPGIFDLGLSHSYLIMSILVFAVAVWMIVLFNLPKKDSFKRLI
jgi:hypothetical protein